MVKMVNMLCILCLIFNGLYVTTVTGYSQGAPIQTQSCLNLQPGHVDPTTRQPIQGISAQAPYEILMSQQFYVPCATAGRCQQQPVQVVIRGMSPPRQQFRTPFRGFIIQARTPSGGQKSWGQFVPFQPRDSKIIQCQNGLSLTHSSNTDKQEVRFNWIPEPNMREQIRFVATVVRNYRTIYQGVYSEAVKANERPESRVTGSFNALNNTTPAVIRPPTTTPRPPPTTTIPTLAPTTTTTPATTRLTLPVTTPSSTTTSTSSTTTTTSITTVIITSTEGSNSGSTVTSGLSAIMFSLLIFFL